MGESVAFAWVQWGESELVGGGWWRVRHLLRCSAVRVSWLEEYGGGCGICLGAVHEMRVN